MENQLQIFSNPDFGDIRAIEVDGEPWLVGKDAATALGYSNPAKALADHVLDKFKLYNESLSSLGQRGGWLINEAGLYKLIMRSKLPNAEKFSDWCCGEVLPSVRKHGIYMTPQAAEKILYNPDFIIGLAQQVKDAQAKIAVLEPKAEYCDNVLLSDEHLTSELIAKEYGHSAHWLHATLIKLNVLYKRGRHHYLKAKYADKNYRVSETVILAGGKTVVSHFWTQAGREFIYWLLKKNNIVPLRERQALMAELL